MSAKSKLIQSIAANAKRSFENHEVIVRHENGLFASWRCGDPEGSSIYHFNITIEPGRLFVTGDLGVLVVERTENMLAWCRQAIDSIDYFAEKVPSGFVTKCWDGDVALEWLDDLKSEVQCQLESDGEEGGDSSELKAIRELQKGLRDGDLWSRDVFHEAVRDADLGDHCDMPSLTQWDSGFLWRRECVRWFLENYQYDPYAANDTKETRERSCV